MVFLANKNYAMKIHQKNHAMNIHVWLGHAVLTNEMKKKTSYYYIIHINV